MHNQSFSTKAIQAVFEVKRTCYLLFKSGICLCIIILVDSVELRLPLMVLDEDKDVFNSKAKHGFLIN